MSAADVRTAAARAATGTGLRRLGAGLAAALIAGVDLGAKTWATSWLRDDVVDLGPLDLRLAYNPGVAFSIGAGAPGWLVVVVTGTISATVAVFAWRTAARGNRAQLVALALVLGGAVANLVDRAADGVVTDYLHAGWWPTFNLADTAIVCGALLLVIASFRQQPDGPAAEPAPDVVSKPRAGQGAEDGSDR